MDLSESNTHSFVVKIWLEDEAQVRWRVTSLTCRAASGDTWMIRGRDSGFIARISKAMGVQPTAFSRLKRRLSTVATGFDRQH